MKYESGGKIMIKFVALRPKTYSYLMYDGNCNKKAKGTKKCIIKREIKFKSYKDCDRNWIRTHNHLVRKRTLNHLAKLTK